VALGIGWVTSIVINTITFSVLAFTGSSFLALIVWALGLLATMYLGGKAAAHAGMSVYTGNAQRWAIESWYEVKGVCSSLFARDGQAEHAEAHYASR
jgi:hypothetical protein